MQLIVSTGQLFVPNNGVYPLPTSLCYNNVFEKTSARTQTAAPTLHIFALLFLSSPIKHNINQPSPFGCWLQLYRSSTTLPKQLLQVTLLPVVPHSSKNFLFHSPSLSTHYLAEHINYYKHLSFRHPNYIAWSAIPTMIFDKLITKRLRNDIHERYPFCNFPFSTAMESCHEC